MLFENLSAFNQYIPHCVICGKEMYYVLSGMLADQKYGGKRIPFRNKFVIEDDVFKAQAKKNKEAIAISININNNQIITGKEILSRLHNGELLKTCSTCHCKITVSFPMVKGETISHLSLNRENVNYVLKGGKPLRIDNNHQAYGGGEPTYYLYINHKYMKSPVPIDLSKFENLKHLNKRLATILTFS